MNEEKPKAAREIIDDAIYDVDARIDELRRLKNKFKNVEYSEGICLAFSHELDFLNNLWRSLKKLDYI